MGRVESPSSINLYKECARKYFYRYIEGRKIPPNIYMVRGNIAHTVLERFYDFQPGNIPKHDCDKVLNDYMSCLLIEEWKNYSDALKAVKITPSQNRDFFEDTLIMLLNWLNAFIKRLKEHPEPTFIGAFKALSPFLKEQKLASSKHKVLGIIDAIHNDHGKVSVVDYKTSREAVITDGYKLQAAIYALIYLEKHGQPPDRIAFEFFKHGTVELPVDPELVELARKEVAYIHTKTITKEIEDYPKTITSKCKWCDFFDFCFQSRDSYQTVLDIKKGNTPKNFQ